MKHYVDEVGKPWSAFSDSQKKTGQSYFAKGLLYYLTTKNMRVIVILRDFYDQLFLLTLHYQNSHII